MKENRLFPKKCRRGLLALAAAGLLSFSGALAADYADGVYQDLAPGYNDDVIVSVTVRDGKITEFDAENRNGNESEYFGKALEGIRQAVLEKQGLRRGSFAYSFRPQDICNRALPELPELAWLTVNVRGCRAYVSVRDRVPKPELADDRTPTNVVAKRDALVTEVRAYDGRAMVRKGGTVTAGQRQRRRGADRGAGAPERSEPPARRARAGPGPDVV